MPPECPLCTPAGCANLADGFKSSLLDQVESVPETKSHPFQHSTGKVSALMTKPDGGTVQIQWLSTQDGLEAKMRLDVAGEYKVTATGCGLCQTRVPCESAIPKSQR